jgi:hypothetical protein
MEFRGTLTEPEFLAGMRLRRRVVHEPGSAWDSVVWFGVVFVALALLGYFSIPRSPESLWWLPFALLCFAVWWRRRSRPLQQWRESIARAGGQSGALGEEAVEARLFGVDARIPWGVFSCHLSSPRALVLFMGSHFQLILGPSQFAGGATWEQACAFVSQRVPRPTEPSILRRVLLWGLLLLVTFLAWHFAQFKK